MLKLAIPILLLLHGKEILCIRPQTSETRSIQLLDGLWNFRYCNRNESRKGHDEEWYRRSLRSGNQTGTISMPVPASFNDITQEKALRDHVGWVWYDREFYVSKDWSNRRVVLRFESVHYYSAVWLNGKSVMEHEGGHLPFEADVTKLLDFSQPNRVTVAVNNTLTPFTLPCGHIVHETDVNKYPPGYFRQELIFDFFNYAGIHRSVLLYTTSSLVYVSEVAVETHLTRADKSADVTYSITTNGSDADHESSACRIEISDVDGNIVSSGQECSRTIAITSPRLWWPVGTNSDVGHQYVLKILLLVNGKIEDFYRQKFGIRTVDSKSGSLRVNGKPVYLTGFGKHEDFHVFGRGFNLPVMIKDFNLIEWIGGNSFRTSHYPYAEEVLDYADDHGIMIIDEAPAVGLHEFPNKTLEHHLQVMTELIARDHNHPSVVMWSVANEPASFLAEAEAYFKRVFEHTRQLDKTRPITFVSGGKNVSNDRAGQFVDILCVNHYFAWYSDPGQTDLIQRQLLYDLRQWHAKFSKPIVVTEYGADTIAGLHTSPSFIFSEEYQIEFMAAYHGAFDQLRKEGLLTGEMIWNFADFMTDQQINRVWGNKKGIFTRERQPKMAAHFLRKRYLKLNRLVKDAMLYGVSLDNADLFDGHSFLDIQVHQL